MKKYNALIREYSGRSLNVLARVLISDLKDFPDDWQIRYDSKHIDKSTTNVGDLCCGPLNPLQIYRPAKESFPIWVRSLSGKCLDIEASKQDTVEVLKFKIFQKDDTLAPHLQKLYFHGNENPKESLWVWRTLDYYKVCSESTVFLKRRTPISETIGQSLTGAPAFTPINVKATYEKIKKPLLQPEDSPSWSRYSAGINFCGICPNSGCVSKMAGEADAQVIGNVISYGTARLDFKHQELKCPACFTNGIRVISLLVCQANAHIRSKSLNPDGNGMQISVESVGTDLYREILLEKKDFLEITSVEPWRSPYTCVGCDVKITMKSEEVRLTCEHTYHTWCQSKSDACRVCCSNVLIVGSAKDVLSAF